MTVITVVLAPDGPAAGVADGLADLSAAGLVDGFAWVTASEMASPEPTATVVDGGRRSTVVLQRWVAAHGHRQGRRVRVVVVVPLGDGELVGSGVEQKLYDVFMAGGAPVEITPIRCLIARPGDQAPSGVVARAGWHNVLVSPEDAQGPGSPRVDLPATADQVEVGRYAAPVVAGVAAMWTGTDRSPLDDVLYPSQPSVRAARGFFRRVDAAAIETELRARVLSTEAPLPLPRDHLGPTEYVADRGQACSRMADALWERHRGVLIGGRTQPDRTPPIDTGPWAAIKQLLAYIWLALRAAPGDFLQSVANRQSVLAAQQVHRMVYGGDDSAYRVVVNGFDDSGLPASWRAMDRATAQIGERLIDRSTERYGAQRPDLRRMWEDYVNGALTLLDSGDRGMPPATVGPNRAILRSAADCVPDPSHDFGPVPPHIRDRTGVGEIMPGDVLQGMSLYGQLNSEPMRAEFGRDAGQTAKALNEWAATHDATYSAQVGRRFADGLLGVIADIQNYVAVLGRAAQERENPAEAEKSTKWTIRILGVLAVLGIVAGPVLGATGVVGAGAATAIALVPLVVWLGYVLVAFVRARRRAFQELHRRRTLLNEADAARINLGQAITDLHRLTDAYDQYLVWTRVLGVVLRRPYGESQVGVQVPIALVRGLPYSTGIARADVDTESLGQAAAALRGDVFVRGWLSDPWSDQLLGAARRLGDYDLMNRAPEEITDMKGVAVADSPLARWSMLLYQQGTDATAGDRVWARVLAGLETRRSDLGVRLLSSVHGVDRLPMDLTEFLAGVDQPRVDARDRFTRELFTARGLAHDHAKIEIHECDARSLGLSRVVTLVQTGEPWPPEDFVVTATEDEPPVPDPEIPEFPRADRVGVPSANGHSSGAHVAPPEPRRDPPPPTPRDVPPPGPPGLA